jgi:DNA polymerase-3 subunit delta'
MKFADVLGNEDVKSTLAQGVASGRIPHAQLIVSREGGGNLALTLAYAQYVFCTDRRETDSCGVCDSCRKMNRLIHPDLTMVFPVAKSSDKSGSDLSSKDFYAEFREAVTANPYLSPDDWFRHAEIDDKVPVINARSANEIIHDMQMKPFEAKYKICLIWLPEMFFHAAVPKLLKIIEEPPANTLFLLVSNNPDDIINTILSRTQLIKLHKIADFDMMGALMNDYGVEMQRAQEIVNIADGDFNKAKWLTNEQDNAQSVNMFREWMLGIYKGDIPALVKFSDSFHTETMDVQKNFLVYCLHLFRESIVKVSDVTDLARTTSSERVFLDKFAKTINPESVVEMRFLIDDVLWQIDRHANAKMLMMALSLRMIPYFMPQKPAGA